MEAGLAIAVISMLGVVAIYFWIVRRPQKEVADNQ
jgi:hypothetical protein